ncbi:MAG: histidinol dehydrogenase [Dissulfurispiraceae bacterium]|nr:histidinol dehydrogenase [Dissulfurispiraceae bacterium]
MTTILKGQKETARFLQLLQKRAAGADEKIESAVKKIIADVARSGDKALKKYTAQFDRHKLPLKITKSEIAASAKKADKKVVAALEISACRIWDFHSKQKESSWVIKKEGATLGQLIRPLARAGVYVPGGKASYPSSVLMNVIPAQVAGVKEIAVCVPTPEGMVSPVVMAAIKLLGITEVYRVGGAQAVAALAYGTDTIKRVDKITGPGNIYVATAKKMVFGQVDIDMIAGPSEILIIADETADASFIAADMLSQAEHDEMASSILVTDSSELVKSVQQELNSQFARLIRKDTAKKSLKKYGAVIKTKSIREAVELSNQIAPEHLELMTSDPESLLDSIKNAGAVFMGKWTPEPLGDYSAGPNHVLPTGGTARFSSPLGVYDFIKRTSLLSFTQRGFNAIAETVETLSDSEGLQAHAETVRVRKRH